MEDSSGALGKGTACEWKIVEVSMSKKAITFDTLFSTPTPSAKQICE